MPSYRLTFIKRDGSLKQWSTSKDDTAPGMDWMARSAERRKAVCVIRYWPSFKAWRILDTRNVMIVATPGRFAKAVGIGMVMREFPTEDAAIMFAVHRLTG